MIFARSEYKTKILIKFLYISIYNVAIKIKNALLSIVTQIEKGMIRSKSNKKAMTLYSEKTKC